MMGDDAEWEYLVSVQAEAPISFFFNVLPDRPEASYLHRVFSAAYAPIKFRYEFSQRIIPGLVKLNRKHLHVNISWQIVIFSAERAVRIGGRISRFFEGSKFDTALDDA